MIHYKFTSNIEKNIYIYIIHIFKHIPYIYIFTFTNPHYPKPRRSFTVRFLLEGHSLELEALETVLKQPKVELKRVSCRLDQIRWSCIYLCLHIYMYICIYMVPPQDLPYLIFLMVFTVYNIYTHIYIYIYTHTHTVQTSFLYSSLIG